MDGPTSSRSRAVPNEAHSEQHIRAPGVGQNAQKMWAQMQNSPRLLETYLSHDVVYDNYVRFAFGFHARALNMMTYSVPYSGCP